MVMTGLSTRVGENVSVVLLTEIWSDSFGWSVLALRLLTVAVTEAVTTGTRTSNTKHAFAALSRVFLIITWLPLILIVSSLRTREEKTTSMMFNHTRARAVSVPDLSASQPLLVDLEKKHRSMRRTQHEEGSQMAGRRARELQPFIFRYENLCDALTACAARASLISHHTLAT